MLSMLKLLVLYFAFGPSFFHLSTARRSVTSTTVTSTSTTVTSTSSTVTSTSANKVPHIVTPTPASQTLPTPTAPLSGPGITIYPQVSYQGRETFLPIPSVALLQAVAIPSGGSFKISDNVVVAVQTDETTFVLSGASASCPNTAELPSNAQSSFVFGIQSTTCWPPCAPNGSCHPNGKCICAEGYAGHLCESCDKGFFGPECHGRCPKDCAHCDDGLAGSGVCNETPNPTKCNCVHGFCDANGQCQCNSGWTGTKCTECAPGYYVSADRCRVCPDKCAECDIRSESDQNTQSFDQDTTACTACLPGFSLSNGICTAESSDCQAGHFSDDGNCKQCSPSCATCVGNAEYCVTCTPSSLLASNGNCCQPGWFQNINTGECSPCHSECASCSGPFFNDCLSCSPSYPVQVQIEGEGRCLQSCSAPSQYWDKDALSCQPCDPSCSTCSGASPQQCLSCPGSQSLTKGSCK